MTFNVLLCLYEDLGFCFVFFFAFWLFISS